MSTRYVVWYLINVPPREGRLFPTGAWVRVVGHDPVRRTVEVETKQGERLTLDTNTGIINSAVLPEGQTP